VSRLFVLVAVLLLAFAPTASAHDADAHTPADRVGNLSSSLTSASLPPGVEVRVLENGQALWLRNTTRIDVVVVTDDGAQQYQVGPDGAAINSALPPQEAPRGDISEVPPQPTTDPSDKAPQWQRISTDPIVRWHDHLVHWGDPTLPKVAVTDPSHDHLIRAWQVGLEYDGKHYEVHGELRWIPGPSALAWVLMTISLAIGASLTAFVRSERWLAVPTAVMVAASAAHGVALITGRDAEDWRTVLMHEYLPLVTAWLVGAAAVALLATGRRNGRWFAALAAVGIGAVALLQDLPVWWSSTSVVALPIDMDRALVTAAAGIAPGLLIALLARPNVTRSR
jgi:hypothetical protein